MNRLSIIAAFFALVFFAGQNALAQSGYDLFQKGLVKERTEGDLDEAIRLYKQIIENHADERTLVAKALVQMGGCYEKLGTAEARTAYERVVRDFADQSEIVAQAKVRLAAIGGPGATGRLVTRRVLADASGVGGVLTADGKYISSNIDRSTGDVIQFEVASGQRTRITNRGPWTETDKSYENQAFSRDGKQIAYNVESSDPNTKAWVQEVRIRNLDGSGLRTLYSEKGSYAVALDWSPDAGSILALRDRNKATELTLISTADGSVDVLRSITSGWFSFQRASFSPDGRFVAFSLVREGSPPNGDVLLMTADGRNEVVVAGHPAEDRLLRWTPDGRSLVFLSDRSGTWDIWTVHITGGKQQGEPELLKKDFGYDSEVLGFAPDGSLYYKTQTYLGCLYHGEVDLETGKILVPPAPVTTRYTGPVAQPTWSPDGRNLAYLSHPGFIGLGNNILTIRSAATGEERFLSPRLRYVNQISWAPDGRSVIAVAITGTGLGIFRIDTETSGITKLTDGGLAPHLCPDGKTLVFVKGETGGPGPIIRKRNLDTGEESEVVLIRGIIYDLSPDGREVVFQVDGAVKAVSLNGGEPRELFRGSARGYGLKWTRDGRYIIVQATGTASSEIWRVPAQGGTPLKLDLAVPKMNDFTLNPDNRRFAFSVDEGSKSELWVLENFLPEEKEDTKFSIRKVKEGTDVGYEGAPSPDGRYLSYVDWDTGDLAIYEIATGNKRRLTNKGSWNESDEFAQYSRWSPDGKQIVYDWSNKNGDIDLYIVGLDGLKSRILYSNDEENTWVQTYGWSPDGKHILACFARKDGQNQMVLVSTADGSVRVLKTLEQGWPSNMNFSPDGRYIVYDFIQKEDSPERDISLLSIDGSREIPLVEHPADDYVLGWAPDGKNILFASDRRNSPDAWVIQFSDGKVQGTPKLVKSDIGQVYPKGFTQKGSFYYDIYDVTKVIYFAELDLEAGKTLALTKKASTRFEGSLNQPEYSPDGKYIAYISVPTNHSTALSIQSLETGKMQEFPTKHLRNMISPRWSPDGRSILVGGWDLKGKKGIWRIDTQSGISTLIVPPANRTENFYFLTTHEWSLDGKTIFLGRLANSLPYLTQIMQRDIESGTEKELYRGSGFLSLSRSPDGKWLAIMNREKVGFLRIMPAAGGEPRDLYRFKEEDILIGIRWAPDGKYILFEQKQANEKKYSWWRIPMEGGEPQKLGLEWDSVFYTSFHPDGRHIVFSSPASISENSGTWVMENFLPEYTADE
jgi:Tol biopolymer transport system component